MKLRPGIFIGNGKYKLVARLGEGGQAEVWGAVQIGLGDFSKEVVLKCVHLDEKTGSEQRNMLLHEARLAARLQHPNIVEIYDVGEEQDLVYIAMERIQGYDLEVILNRSLELFQHSIPWKLAVYIVIEVSKGLHYAHSHVGRDGRPLHLVHRDLKPSNILLSRNGFVKVIDFGIAKATNQRSTAQEGQTMNGQIKGTPAYMSPEQIYARPLDARSDLFALGSILYELCCGERPFTGDEVFSIMMAVTQNAPSSLFARVPEIPAQLEDVVFRLLEKEPEKRYQNARDLQRELDMILRERDLYIDQEDLARFYEKAMADYVPSKGKGALVDASQDFKSLAKSVEIEFVGFGEGNDFVLPGFPEASYNPMMNAGASAQREQKEAWDIDVLSETDFDHGDETMAGDETFLEGQLGGDASQRESVEMVSFATEGGGEMAPNTPLPKANRLETRQVPAFVEPKPLNDLIGPPSSEQLPAQKAKGSPSERSLALGKHESDALALLDVYDGKEDALEAVFAPTETFMGLSKDGDQTNLNPLASPHSTETPTKGLPTPSNELLPEFSQERLSPPSSPMPQKDEPPSRDALPRPPFAESRSPSLVEVPKIGSSRPPSLAEVPKLGSSRPPSLSEVPNVGSARPPSFGDVQQLNARPPSLAEVPKIGGSSRPPVSPYESPYLSSSSDAISMQRGDLANEPSQPRLIAPPEVQMTSPERATPPARSSSDKFQPGTVSFSELERNKHKNAPSAGQLESLYQSGARNSQPVPDSLMRSPLKVGTGQIPRIADFSAGAPPPHFVVEPRSAPPIPELEMDAPQRFVPLPPPRPPQAAATPAKKSNKLSAILFSLLALLLLLLGFFAFRWWQEHTLIDGKANVIIESNIPLHVSLLHEDGKVKQYLGLSTDGAFLLKPASYTFGFQNKDHHLTIKDDYHISDRRRTQTITFEFKMSQIILRSPHYPAKIYYPALRKIIGETGKPFRFPRNVAATLELHYLNNPEIRKPYHLDAQSSEEVTLTVLWTREEFEKEKKRIEAKNAKANPPPPREEIQPEPDKKKNKKPKKRKRK